ncbi:nuclease-related domain-containing protein [Cytobacillus oceanisediminis]|nr:nuclease-related domain-containing protein [Cytobacillus oceanisediminis]
MIKKERKVSDFITKLEALIRRMPEMEPGRERAVSELNKRRAGYIGEQKLDYYLSFLDEKEYWIYHGLRLSNGSQFFQIDTLLLTKEFAMILEVKNWNGTIIFEPEFHQLIRIHNEKEEAFHDPISQAEHQSRQLK